MEILRKYGVQTDIYFPLIKRGVQDFAVSADFTHASGDTKISKNGGTAANTTNSPSAIAMGNGAMWKLTLTATEMEAALIQVTVIDAATKAVEDQMIIISTYGHASAQHPFDLATATQNVNVSSISNNAITTASINNGAFTDAKFAADFLTAAKVAADVGTEIADALWNRLTSALTTTGSIGKLLVDNIDAAISSRLASASYTAPDNAGIAAIQAKTDNLPADPASTGDIPTTVEVADAVLDGAIAEPGGVFAWGSATLRNIVGWMGALSRNKMTQDDTETVLRNEADDADIAASQIEESSGTFTRGEWT